MPERLIPIGRIVTTHGLDGWLKVNPFNPQTNAFASAQTIFLERDGQRSAHPLASSKPHKGQFLIKLADVHQIDAAEKWVGATLSVEERALESLSAGEYYHYQALGLEVFDTRGERIGVVTHVWSTPAGELYVVQGPIKEHLIPAVKEIVEKVDFSVGRMIVNPPEGLLDL